VFGAWLKVFAAALTIALTDGAVASAQSDAEQEESASDPAVRSALLWSLAQIVPSPEVAYGEATARFGLRWQVTPLLYSFGIYRQAWRWRAFVVEPFVRQSGSVELFLGPEYLVQGRGLADGWLWRIGARSYFPIIERGESLSVSVGTSYSELAGHRGVAYEAGVYTLFGLVGAQITWSPTGGEATTIATLRLRYF